MNIQEKFDMASKIIDGNYAYNRDTFFSYVYPFTTENISGYMPLFEMDNKSLLTIGSSGDQVLNAILCGCRDIDVYDLCPFCREYFDLKRAAIEVLTREEFLNFFCYRNYPKNFICNDDAFNLNCYFKIRELLKNINYESFCFWDMLFARYGCLSIRRRLFTDDEYFHGVITKMNNYLVNDEMFLNLRSKISDADVRFKIGNIFDADISRSYDNIFLSNIASYNDILKMKELFDKLIPYLNDDGRILIAYLYQTVIDSRYDDDWAPIYNVKNTLELFDSNVEFSSFIGPRGIIHGDETIKDSVITYKKLKKCRNCVEILK